MPSERPLLIVDGDNLAHRAYHSTPKSVLGSDGQGINAIVGFFGMLLNVWRREQPRHAFIAWDTIGVDTYRNKLWPPYQGGRVFEPSILRQLDQLPNLCRAFGFGVGKGAGFEADDFMAAAAAAEVANGGACLLLTTDRDSYQLVSDRVTALVPRRGSPEPARIGPMEVVREMGVLPEQVPDYKALCGDPSDKIPGAKGVGPKAAAALLLKHGSLDNVVACWTKTEETERVLMFRQVVTMQLNAAAEVPTGSPQWEAGAEALKTLGATDLAERVASFAA